MSINNIIATVGEGGANIPSDVATVQYLLNCVPVSNGGLAKKLKIDGFAGVVTIEAIRRFQKFNFGLSNSRVEAGEATFSELKKYDLSPFSAPIVTPNFNSSISEKMDPSKMNRGIRNTIPNVGPIIGRNGIGKDVDGGTIKGRLYGGVKDDSV